MVNTSPPIAMAYMSDVLPPELRAGSFGVLLACFSLGLFSASFMVTLIGRTLYILQLSIAILLFSAFMGLVFLPESLAPENRRDRAA